MTAGPDVESILAPAAGLLLRELGLRPDPSILGRLRRCLADEAAARHESPATYLATLTDSPEARQALFNSVTVQETAFFRHPGQFEALARQVIPRIRGPVTVWSAGCANGQEAYSLAMVLDEAGRDGTVMATDVSTRALERAASARYSTRELSGLSAARRDRYLVATPGGWQIRPGLRRRVTFGHHNLATGALPDFVARCQVVFCRNVLIYFSPEHAISLLRRLATELQVDACLFLGYAETIWQVTDVFEPVRIGEAFEYHRRRQTPLAAPAVASTTAASLRTGRATDTGADPGRRPARSSERADRNGAQNEDPLRATDEPAHRSDEPAGGHDDEPPRAIVDPAAEPERAGQAASADGDHQAAIVAFRKCTYLAPDEPMGHVNLGFALEAAGDLEAAQRAFQAARSALRRRQSSDGEPALGGYRVEELAVLLDRKRQARGQ